MRRQSKARPHRRRSRLPREPVGREFRRARSTEGWRTANGRAGFPKRIDRHARSRARTSPARGPRLRRSLARAPGHSAIGAPSRARVPPALLVGSRRSCAHWTMTGSAGRTVHGSMAGSQAEFVNHPCDNPRNTPTTDLFGSASLISATAACAFPSGQPKEARGRARPRPIRCPSQR